MSDTAQLLWEVGCEELPAWACEQIALQLPALVRDGLGGERLLPDADADDLVVHVGPRRFSASLEVRSEQVEVREERKGPAVRAAFDGGDPAGTPTKACEGFARGLGLTPADLEVRDVDGTQFVFGVRELPAAPFAEVWPGIAGNILSGLKFAKPMRWGSSPHRFVRPVRWVATLLGDRAVDYDLWGVASSNVSRAHRFLGAQRTVTIANASDYVTSLQAGHVVADQAERRALIVQGLDAAAAAANGEWYDPAGALDEVVHLVEQPTVITGHFADSYLELPERVLVTAMQSHQRYFPVRTGSGLAPVFLAAMNGDTAALDTIVPGYERVLAGRLDDAVFSFERDRERGLDDMASDSSLGAVVFHVKAGTLANRRDRIAALAAALAAQLDVDSAQVATAAQLAKADQVSYVVQEFAELEGFAGSLYARAAGHDESIATAIDQQFRPRSATAELPDRGVPAVIALADKLDLLTTMFAIGEQPSGSRDPHGLRRAAIGITRIVLEYDLPLQLDAVLDVAGATLQAQGFGTWSDEIASTVREFVLDRVEKHLTDSGIGIDAVRAARGAQLPLLQHYDALARAIASMSTAGDEQFLALLEGAKRCRNLLDKAGDGAAAGTFDDGRFETDAERGLAGAIGAATGAVASAVDARDFNAAVASASKLGPALDVFFAKDTGVMVMADDAAVKANRLALLDGVLGAVAPLGDLSQVQVG